MNLSTFFASATRLDDNPLMLLTPDERAKILKTATTLNRLYEELSAIDEDWCEREEAVCTQSHCNNHGDSLHRSESAATPQDEDFCLSDVDAYGFAHRDSCGPKGRSGHGPIAPILASLREGIDRIATLFHKEFLQTISGREAFLTFARQSDDAEAHDMLL